MPRGDATSSVWSDVEGGMDRTADSLTVRFTHSVDSHRGLMYEAGRDRAGEIQSDIKKEG